MYSKKIFDEVYPIFHKFQLNQMEKRKKKYLGKEVLIKNTINCGHAIGVEKGRKDNLNGTIIGYQRGIGNYPIIKTPFGIVHVMWEHIDYTQEIRNGKLKKLGI